MVIAMTFLVAPIISALVGAIAGKAMAPKAPKLPPPTPPPDAPIQPSNTAAAERARRAGTPGRGVNALVLSPLGGSASAAGTARKSKLGL